MIAVAFPEANMTFVPPESLDESQCRPIRAYVGQIQEGSMDGCPVVVTAWQPTPQELKRLLQGSPIFLSFVAHGLAPHYACTSFEEATHPA